MMINIKNLPILKPLFSRRNEVFLSEIQCNGKTTMVIVKECRSTEEAQTESEILRFLRDRKISVPEVYDVRDKYLLLEYLQGFLLTDLVDSKCNHPNWVTELAKWFANLHLSTLDNQGKVLLKGDSNLRNFILTSKGFFGLDFEEKIYAYPEKDLGECCAYILANNPMFSNEKLLIVRKFINDYKLYNNTCNLTLVEDESLTFLESIAIRRAEHRQEIRKGINAISNENILF